MPPFRSLTDADGRTVGEHVERLKRTLDGLGARLRDAVAQALGETVSGAVQAAIRASLADVGGRSQQSERKYFHGHGPPNYWEDDAYGWGRPYPERHATDEPDDDAPAEDNGNLSSRWRQLALLGSQVLAVLLRRRTNRPPWQTAVAVGVLLALAAVAGVPCGITSSAANLSALADLIRSGVAALTSISA